MTNNHKQIIALIAERNRTIISDDDPILILNTLFEYAVEQLDNKNQAQQHQLNQHIESILARLEHSMDNSLINWSDSIDKKAELLIRVGLEENRDQIAVAKKKFFADLESQIANQQVITSAAAEKIQKAAKLNYMVGAFLSVAVAVV
ncbi:hypothetical protein, partial [Shewanella sairae]